MEQHPQALARSAEQGGQDGQPAGDDPGAPNPTRRSFLKAAPLAAVAAVTGSAGATEAPSAPPAAAPQVKRGYHETEHIRRYYETAAYW